MENVAAHVPPKAADEPLIAFFTQLSTFALEPFASTANMDIQPVRFFDRAVECQHQHGVGGIRSPSIRRPDYAPACANLKGLEKAVGVTASGGSP